MSSAVVQAAEIDRWLRAEKHVRVDREWLEACCEWLGEQQNGSRLDVSELKSRIYEQWLFSDLSDCGEACLATAMRRLSGGPLHSETLEGVFSVQVNSVLNVAAPAYSQIQALKGQEIKEEGEGEGKATGSGAKAPRSRMLMMEITDGHLNLQAMEYRTIGNDFSQQTPPGTKVLLRGPVKCRLGTLLLTENHLQLLGGEVEAMVRENTPIKVLARALGKEELAASPGGLPRTAQPSPTTTSTAQRNHSASTSNPPSYPTSSYRPSSFPSSYSTPFSTSTYSSTTSSSSSTALAGGGRGCQMTDRQPRNVKATTGTGKLALSASQEQLGDVKSHDYHMTDVDVDPWEDIDFENFNDYEDLGCHGNPSPGRGGSSVVTCRASSVAMETSPKSKPVCRVEPMSQLEVERENEENVIMLDDSLQKPAIAESLDHKPSLPGGSGGVVPTCMVEQLASEVAGLGSGRVKVRARCVGTDGKLCSEGGSWTLKVVVRDSTGQATVELSDQVLEQIIGFSAVFFKQNIESWTGQDKGLRAVAKAGFRRCQLTLSQLHCWMEVGVAPDRTHPLVFKLC